MMAKHIVVVYYKHPGGVETAETAFSNADIHISINGVLVVRCEDSKKIKHAYSAGTWHSAKEG